MKTNDYAKEGKQFLKRVSRYFKDVERVHDAEIYSSYLSSTLLPLDKWPNPSMIVDDMSMLLHSKDYILPLQFHGCGFDGLFEIPQKSIISGRNLKVYASDMGAWQLTLLYVLSKHVMPLFQHANYIKWKPLFDRRDFLKHRKSHREWLFNREDTYEMIPEDLLCETTVITLEEGRKYKTSFYVWSDFGGYIKVTSTIKFPAQSTFVDVEDVMIMHKTEVIFVYRCDMIF